MSADPFRRSDWTVHTIGEHADAVNVIARCHYAHGAPNTSVARHGLFPREFRLGDPVGVVLWLPPTKAAATTVAGTDWRMVLSLSRFVIEDGLPTNAASFLLGHSMRMVDRRRWPVLLTYADTGQGHTGTIYQATNWTCLGPVPAGDTWVNERGEQRGRKRGGRTLTVAEMTALGFTRQPAKPKIKYVHVAPWWARNSRRRAAP